jgi:2-C-methyl-D-erythritol 2,4-cyclodiphosphate synthase
VRVGLGFDSHEFTDDAQRALVLGGVRFDGEQGLSGHSDADVVAHAVADALLGAAGLGDLGDHFPDTDPAWSAADSLRLLALVVERVGVAGWRPVNVDCTVVLDAPKLAPRRGEMRDGLSGVVGAPVSVKATRPEGWALEGIACWAVALVEER